MDKKELIDGYIYIIEWNNIKKEATYCEIQSGRGFFFVDSHDSPINVDDVTIIKQLGLDKRELIHGQFYVIQYDNVEELAEFRNDFPEGERFYCVGDIIPIELDNVVIIERAKL